MLALLGIHQHLSAEQKQDIAIAAVQTTPGAASAGAATADAGGMHAGQIGMLQRPICIGIWCFIWCFMAGMAAGAHDVCAGGNWRSRMSSTRFSPPSASADTGSSKARA